jgi:hypothetical protein
MILRRQWWRRRRIYGGVWFTRIMRILAFNQTPPIFFYLGYTALRHYLTFIELCARSRFSKSLGFQTHVDLIKCRVGSMSGGGSFNMAHTRSVASLGQVGPCLHV